MALHRCGWFEDLQLPYGRVSDLSSFLSRSTYVHRTKVEFDFSSHGERGRRRVRLWSPVLRLRRTNQGSSIRKPSGRVF